MLLKLAVLGVMHCLLMNLNTYAGPKFSTLQKRLTPPLSLSLTSIDTPRLSSEPILDNLPPEILLGEYSDRETSLLDILSRQSLNDYYLFFEKITDGTSMENHRIASEISYRVILSVLKEVTLDSASFSSIQLVMSRSGKSNLRGELRRNLKIDARYAARDAAKSSGWSVLNDPMSNPAWNVGWQKVRNLLWSALFLNSKEFVEHNFPMTATLNADYLGQKAYQLTQFYVLDWIQKNGSAYRNLTYNAVLEALRDPEVLNSARLDLETNHELLKSTQNETNSIYLLHFFEFVEDLSMI